MATFLLLSGSWHGGWSWQRVAPRLRAAGHDVFTPTYTGVGDRVHLGGPHVSMATHIQDIVQVLTYEDLWDVTLVGHSYGGVVMTGVANAAPDRIQRMIYLDTSVAKDGHSVIRLMPESSRDVVRSRTDADGWRVWPTTVERLGITDPADQRWVAERLTTHPIGGFTTPIEVGDAVAGIPRGYIACQRQPGQPLRLGAQYAVEQGWPLEVLLSGHDAMISEPEALAAAILRLSGNR